MKRKLLIIIVIIVLYLNYSVDDPRIQINKRYTITQTSDTYLMGQDDKGNHIALERNNNEQVGQGIYATIIIDEVYLVHQ
jgi:hypothetical protein